MSSKSRSANDYVQTALTLMQTSPPQYHAASCIFLFLYQNISESERPKVAKFLVQCGIALHDETLMNYVLQLPQEISPQCQLARFMLNTTLHEEKRQSCISEVNFQQEFRSAKWDECILVCAGGEKLMQQLYCNLKSLEVFQYANEEWGELQRIPIVIAHADEISESEGEEFKDAFPCFSLVFFNIAESILVLESHLTANTLRGFQIKLAAMVAVPARRVLMMDADLLWLNDPRQIISKCKESKTHAHLFRDFWHFVKRRHEKSSSTSFLYSLHGLDFDISEFESGVVYFDRENAYKSIAMLRHMVLNYEYYFSLTFGDKDLFYLALKSQNATISMSDIPKMLGCVYQDRDDRDHGVFYSQSMLQLFNSQPSHIHTTLHPVGDDGFDVPSHLCEDGEKIEFVQRRINDKLVGTVACAVSDTTVLDAVNIFKHVYLSALRDQAKYSSKGSFKK